MRLLSWQNKAPLPLLFPSTVFGGHLSLPLYLSSPWCDHSQVPGKSCSSPWILEWRHCGGDSLDFSVSLPGKCCIHRHQAEDRGKCSSLLLHHFTTFVRSEHHYRSQNALFLMLHFALNRNMSKSEKDTKSYSRCMRFWLMERHHWYRYFSFD